MLIYISSLSPSPFFRQSLQHHEPFKKTRYRQKKSPPLLPQRIHLTKPYLAQNHPPQPPKMSTVPTLPNQPIFTLMNLISHKSAPTLPPPFPISPAITASTFTLNQAIREQVKITKDRNLIVLSGSEALRQAFAEVETLVAEWGYDADGGEELTEKIALALTYRRLAQAMYDL